MNFNYGLLLKSGNIIAGFIIIQHALLNSREPLLMALTNFLYGYKQPLIALNAVSHL